MQQIDSQKKTNMERTAVEKRPKPRPTTRPAAIPPDPELSARQMREAGQSALGIFLIDWLRPLSDVLASAGYRVSINGRGGDLVVVAISHPKTGAAL